QLRSCEEKGVIRTILPETNGRNRTSQYLFIELESEQLSRSGGDVPAFFTKRIGDKKGTERGRRASHNKEEPRTVNRKEQSTTNEIVLMSEAGEDGENLSQRTYVL